MEFLAADATRTDRIFDIYLPAMWDGLWVTLALTFFGILYTAVVAIITGLMRVSPRWWLRAPARVFVDFFRSTSLFVQLFWLFFAMPALGWKLDLAGVGDTGDKIFVGVVALGLNFGAYASEIVRGSIQAVPKAQYEATVALNLTPLQRMRRVILPQAFPMMIPPFGNTVIELLKSTSLVYVIAAADLTYNLNKEAGQYGSDYFMVLALLLIVYFIIAQIMIVGMRWLEKRANTSVGKAPPPSWLVTKLKARSHVEGV